MVLMVVNDNSISIFFHYYLNMKPVIIIEIIITHYYVFFT